MKITFKKFGIDLKMEGELGDCIEFLKFIDTQYGDEPLEEPFFNFDPAKAPVTESPVVEEKVEIIEKVEKVNPVKPAHNKLYIHKCLECETIYATHINVNEKSHTILCKHCESERIIFVDALIRGSYECRCGSRGYFLQEDNLSSVKCIGCKKEIYMVYNQDTDSYRGI